MNSSSWRGVFPTLTTKFKPDFSLDLNAMAEHLEYQLEAGARDTVRQALADRPGAPST